MAEETKNPLEEIEELKKKLAAAEKKAKTAEKRAEEAELQLVTQPLQANEPVMPGRAKTVAEILAEEEKVEFTLFKDDGKYKDDLYVCVGGMSYQIKRGVPVKVPKSVYEAIRNSEKQDREAADRLAALREKANNADALV